MENLRRLQRRIGRRGGVLFFIGILDSIFAINLLIIDNPNNERVYGAFVSLQVWALLWAIAGLAAWSSIPMRMDRIGFSCSAIILTLWGILAVVSWLRGDLPNGWLTATFFLVLDGLILIPASWPEPRQLVASVVDESFPDAVITADDRGMITGWLGSAEKMFGWSRDEVLGRSIDMIIPIRYRRTHGDGLASVRETGRSRLAGKVLKAEGLHKSGTEFPVHVVIGVHHTDAGIAFSTTISDERRSA